MPQLIRTVHGKLRNVLVCRGHGDLYNGPLKGWEGKRTRVGGVIVSKQFFASGKFEVVMKIGERKPAAGGPEDPMRPIGMVPAIWTYSYRYVTAGDHPPNRFHAHNPMFNPLQAKRGTRFNEYWSELDFPEFGKKQNLEQGLYNTFLHHNHHPKTFSTRAAIDGGYHTFTPIWRTQLVPLPGVTDEQVVKYGGHHWIQDKAVLFAKYRANPLKRLGEGLATRRRGRCPRHPHAGHLVQHGRQRHSRAAMIARETSNPQHRVPAHQLRKAAPDLSSS